jgi:RNase P/RNase MRP subunit POP5
MTLIPTLREKRRYLHFEVVCSEASEEEAKQALYAGLLAFLGEQGVALANPKLIKYDAKTRRGILRCRRDALEAVRAAVALISSVDAKRARIDVINVSGSIKKARAL